MIKKLWVINPEYTNVTLEEVVPDMHHDGFWYCDTYNFSGRMNSSVFETEHEARIGLRVGLKNIIKNLQEGFEENEKRIQEIRRDAWADSREW